MPRFSDGWWERVKSLGVVLPVNRVVGVGDDSLEIVGTCADRTQTLVIYRDTSRFMIFPYLATPEPFGRSGPGYTGSVDGLHVSRLPAVAPEVTSITVGFVSFGGPGSIPDIELPVDRERTRRFERRFAAITADVDLGHFGVQVGTFEVGVFGAVVDIDIAAHATDVVAMRMNLGELEPHAVREVGTGPLWREWEPPPDPQPLDWSRPPTPRPDQPDDHSSPIGRPVRGEGWVVRVEPGGEKISEAATSGDGLGNIDSPLLATVEFEPPSGAARELVLSHDELFVFRLCDGQIVDVPAPSTVDPVDLRSYQLPAGSDRIELVRWQPGYRRLPVLILASGDGALWPDVRILDGETSVSLRISARSNGNLIGELPDDWPTTSSNGNPVRLAVRMIGRRTPVPEIRFRAA